MNNRGLASFFDFSQIDISKLQRKTIETLYDRDFNHSGRHFRADFRTTTFETSGRKGILSRLLYWLAIL